MGARRSCGQLIIHVCHEPHILHGFIQLKNMTTVNLSNLYILSK
jgi:hypothetical protein